MTMVCGHAPIIPHNASVILGNTHTLLFVPEPQSMEVTETVESGKASVKGVQKPAGKSNVTEAVAYGRSTAAVQSLAQLSSLVGSR